MSQADDSNAAAADATETTTDTTATDAANTTTETQDAAPDASTASKEADVAVTDNTNDKDAAASTTTEATKKDDEVKDESKEEVALFPKTMKAIVLTSHNEDLFSGVQIAEMPVPVPVNNQVLVKVEAASLNPVDYKIGKGWMAALIKVKMPFVMGRDCSGTVVKCGTGVKNLKPGMRVAGMVDTSIKSGTLAEYALLTEGCAVEIPDNLSFNDAASVPLVSQTSYQAMFDKGKLSKGNKVLIFGGSTSTGIFAIQYAKIMEASEIVTTSSQEDLCTSLGATKVYNYRKPEQDWFKDLQGKDFDIVYDCVGGKEHWDKAQKILKKNGRFMTIVGDETHGNKITAGGLFGMAASLANRKFWGAVGYQSYDFVMTNAKKSFPQIVEYFKQGKLRTVLDKESPFTFDNYKDAFTKSMAHKARGKLVVEIKGGVAEPLPVTTPKPTPAATKATPAKDSSATDANADAGASKDATQDTANADSDATMKSAANDDANADDASGAAKETEKTDEPAKDAEKTDEPAKDATTDDAAAGDAGAADASA